MNPATTMMIDEPVAFDTFKEAFSRARWYEDRVDAIADYHARFDPPGVRCVRCHKFSGACACIGRGGESGPFILEAKYDGK